MPRYFGSGSARQREALFRHSLCLAGFAIDRKKGSIMRGVAIIPVDRARGNGDLVSCVVEELTHVMGLPNDSPKVFPSIFSRKSTQAFLTGLDHLLLGMFYDPRVKPGMDENTVRPILRAIAAEYQRDKRFDSAEKIAAESGLAGLNPLDRRGPQTTPAVRNAAMSAWLRPSSRSTASVSWPSGGGARR